MDTTDKKRQQFTDVLSISISPARCATHLKQYLINKDVEDEFKKLRDQIKSPDISDSEKDLIKTQISSLSQKIVRISNETSTVIAIICNGFVNELLRHGIKESINSNKKMVDIESIISGDHKNNLYYSIYYKLPSFNAYDPKVYEAIKKEKTEHNKKNKKSKTEETKEEDEKEETKEKEEEKVEKSDVEENTHNGEEDGNKITFNSYVEAIIKIIKFDPQYNKDKDNKIRFEQEVRYYLSNMIIECIKRFVVLSKIIVQQIMGVRTMNSNHIKAIIHMFMKDEGNTDEQIDEIINNIDEKLKIYHEHVKNEKNNRYNVLSDEEKKKIMDNKAERVKTRKQKDIVLAKRRAEEAAERLKKLSEEATSSN